MDEILSSGGDVTTGCIPGSFRALAGKYKVSGITISKIWRTFCQTGMYFPSHTAKGKPKTLEEPELDLIQLLIKQRPLLLTKR